MNLENRLMEWDREYFDGILGENAIFMHYFTTPNELPVIKQIKRAMNKNGADGLYYYITKDIFIRDTYRDSQKGEIILLHEMIHAYHDCIGLVYCGHGMEFRKEMRKLSSKIWGFKPGYTESIRLFDLPQN